ncbi:YqgE/AlgH family protein [Sphaerisporangium sp. TRM90804]|uniref:YqgE/AlgH family protein n=1 Tax=Sphaerisporangium sp. TRM90804 TaxID=3031113 RepID=UPI002449BAEF|nr:YqgE/AlgH family protein [Sphaerisporangium sp. TRM90804]MDH2430007.1 YqgE/AlgH family protein [Sphaerisporangium sp. TRM90804]
MAEAIYVGGLLVATPLLDDPNFRRGVVLILEHDDDGGTLGVVLNRPSEVSVTQVLPSWDPLVTGPSVLFEGGPVQTDSALALASVPSGQEPLGWRRLHAGTSAVSKLGTVDLDAPPEILAGEITQMRIFAGYAGWTAGQLETEIRDGSWYVVEAEPGDTFDSRPSNLWRSVLRRQPGELAFVATCPDDPKLN